VARLWLLSGAALHPTAIEPDAQLIARFEEWQRLLVHLDRLAGHRIARDAGVALLHREGAEPSQLDTLPVSQSGGDLVEYRHHDEFRLRHPLLRRAGELFSTLTVQSFTGLRTDFDDRDEPVLVGVRQNGRRVRVEAMSEGTRDQLYLALRLATLERYLAHAEPLPFIVDVLINFDDERSEATLKALAELSKKTQVILFTHHAHLRDLAAGLQNGAGVFVRELGPIG